jgi:hypothetical protein
MLSAGFMAWDHSIAMSLPRAYRAGQSIEDYCRACKVDRIHTVLVADGSGYAIRVQCDYCDSQHNFRGGPRTDAPDAVSLPPARREAAPIIADREHRAANRVPNREPNMNQGSPTPEQGDLEQLLRRILREEGGLTIVTPSQKWRGGTLVLKPGTPGLQDKSWPIDTFFHKIVMLRNRLRTLEQQVNASELPDDTKVKLQSYISGCYGSLTSFNVLFADEADQFKGSGGAD